MNVLIFSYDWAPSVGGVQSAMMSLAEGIASKTTDAQHLIGLVTQTPAEREYDQRFGFAVFRRPGWLRLAKLIQRCDVLHLAGPALKPLILAKLLGKKVVIQHHGYQAICPDGLLLDSRTQASCENSFQRGNLVNCLGCRAENIGWLRGALSVALGYPRRWISKRANANVSVSNHVKAKLNFPVSSTIYNGTREPRVSASGPAPAPPYRVMSAPPVFAFVGRLVAEKGVEVLLRAAAQLSRERKFRLKIIGDGPEREKLKGLVNELHLLYVVEFFGWVQEPDLSAVIEDCTGIIMPSICEEAAPLSAIEQMMRGKLIIASDIGGLSEMVGSTGLKFPAGNAHALARCMEIAIDDLELRRALSSAAQLRARQLFSADRMVTDHLKLYRDLLRKRRAPRRTYRSAPSDAWIASLGERLKSFITAT